jgi:hypothetical protein
MLAAIAFSVQSRCPLRMYYHIHFAPAAKVCIPPSLLELLLYAELMVHARKGLEAAQFCEFPTGVSVGFGLLSLKTAGQLRSAERHVQ